MNQRIDYLDTVRFVAMSLMIICHACDPFNAGATYGEGQVNEEMFLWGSIWGSGVRACVPLFAMLTGALCLTTELPMQTFWRRRISRVLWPFLIWSVIYNMFPWFVHLIGQPESRVYDFFVWASNPSGDLGVCLRRVAEIPFKFDNLACHMWYVYMLIGLYLILPILATWVRQASRLQVELVLLLWLLSTCLPYLHEYVGRYLFGECEWNEFGTFYYFSGFAGYMLLGYHLVHRVQPRLVPSLVYAVPAFIAGAIFTWKGFTQMTALPNATPEQMELFWYFCSPNVVLMASAVFIVVRYVRLSESVVRALRNFTVCGFGIYMIHYFFVGPTYTLIEACHLPTPLRVPAASLLIICISWGIVALIKRYLPRTKWLLG